MTLTRYRVYSALFVLACFVLACVPTYAAQSHPFPAPSPRAIANAHKYNPNSPRMQAARAELQKEAAGLAAPELKSVTPLTSSSKYKRYVGCSDSPYDETYYTISDALIGGVNGPVLPYTTIYVCPGQYPGDNIVTASNVTIVGVNKGQGAESVDCTYLDNTSAPGIRLEGSNDTVKYLTINNCQTGVDMENVDGNYAAIRNDEVVNSFFNTDEYGVYSSDCSGCEVEHSEFSDNLYAISNDYDVRDQFLDNEILGFGEFYYPNGTTTNTPSQFPTGITLQQSVGTVVKGNRVSAYYVGLYVYQYNTYSKIKDNTFNGNGAGVVLEEDNSGNLLEKNTADGNYYVGFYSDWTEGADAVPTSGPNKFIDNKAFGNGNSFTPNPSNGDGYDYFDGTFPYTGNDPNTNAGTADYYKGNKGNNAYPPAILFQ